MSLISGYFFLNAIKTISSHSNFAQDLSTASHFVSQVAQRNIEALTSLFTPPPIIPFHGHCTDHSHLFPTLIPLNPSSYSIGPERDLALVWEKLAFLIDEYAYINPDNPHLSEQFDQWMTRNQPALARITELDLSSSGLTTVPPQLSRLNNLKYLNLSNNSLTLLPPPLANLKKLTSLYVEFNQLQESPSFLPKTCLISEIGNPAISRKSQELKPRTF